MSEHDDASGFDLDAVFSLLEPVAAFVTPYVDAVTDAAPEVQVHLIKSARELCVAVEGFLGALEHAAESAAAQHAAKAGPSVTVVPDEPTSDVQSA